MIVVLGDFMVDRDLHFRTMRKSPDDDCPIVIRESTAQRPGGAGAVVEMIRGMGEEWIAIGEDDKPKCIKRRYFVDGRQVFREDTEFTHAITDALAAELVEQIPLDALVLIADYAKGLITDYLWRQLIERHDRVIVDPSRSRPLAWYHGAMGILPNRVEARVSSLSEAIERCHELRQIFQRVCIKLDRDGMIISSDGYGCHIAAECPEPLDVTGCGDMCLAAIGVGLTRGMSWLDACRFANHMAGLKCRQHGATAVPCDFTVPV